MYCICLTQVTIEYEFPLILICSDYLVSYATLQQIFIFSFFLSLALTNENSITSEDKHSMTLKHCHFVICKSLEKLSCYKFQVIDFEMIVKKC